MEKKVALVDVDSTLWDFIAEMVQRMRIMFPEDDIPEQFATWEDPISYFEKPEDAYAMFNDIHLSQDTFDTYDHANTVLKTLRSMGYYILIASNRIPESKPQLVAWLKKHNLRHNEVYCELDKRELFNSSKIDLVIDDSPYVQEAALLKNIPVLTLKFPYNEKILGTKKFNNLKDMNTYMVNSIMLG